MILTSFKNRLNIVLKTISILFVLFFLVAFLFYFHKNVSNLNASELILSIRTKFSFIFRSFAGKHVSQFQNENRDIRVEATRNRFPENYDYYVEKNNKINSVSVRDKMPVNRPDPKVWNTYTPPLNQPLVPPLVIAHRGASGYLPEHTLEAYKLALDMGADFIELDVVSTKDHELIVRHDFLLEETTNIASLKKFANRNNTKCFYGYCHKGWFVNDFTLKEIKELKAVQRLTFRNTTFDGLFDVPTFSEVLQFLKDERLNRDRMFGVYIEMKRPKYFESVGLGLEEKLIEFLVDFGYFELSDTPNRATYNENLEKRTEGLNEILYFRSLFPLFSNTRKKTDNNQDQLYTSSLKPSVPSPVFIQCFELKALESIHKYTSNLIYLIDPWGNDPSTDINYNYYTTVEGLSNISNLVKGIGPYKEMIVPYNRSATDPADYLLPPTALVNDAHFQGLFVHPWTFRSDIPQYLPKGYASPSEEYDHFFQLGIDALFSDFADQAVESRNKFILGDLIDYSNSYHNYIAEIKSIKNEKKEIIYLNEDNFSKALWFSLTCISFIAGILFSLGIRKKISCFVYQKPSETPSFELINIADLDEESSV